MPLGTWGPVTFETSSDRIRTWSSASRSGAARWTEHVVHLGKPLREFLGPGLDTVSMQVRLDMAHGVTPKDELVTLREQRDLGAYHDLVIGDRVEGSFSLDDIREDWTRTVANGVLRIAIVTLTFKEYA